LTGDGNEILNAGLASGGDFGIRVSGTGSVVTNTGEARGGRDGINIVTSATVNNSGTIVGGTNGLTGGTQDDVVNNTGTIFGDVDLGEGVDVYDGLGGGRVTGTIDMGLGDDRLIIDQAGASIDGGGGFDRLFAYADVTDVTGVEFITLEGGKNLSVRGSASDESVFGNSGNNELRGNDGADSLYGQGGDDLLFGGRARDRLLGDEGDDVLRGEEDNDVLNGGVGDDTLFGGSESDVLLGGIGIDHLDGGDGNDLGDYSHTNVNVTFDLAAGFAHFDFAGGLTERMISIENIIAGGGADTILGDSASNFLDGGAGGDTIFGGAGDDQISGDVGLDSMDGGAGFDSVFFTHTDLDGVFDLAAGTADFSGAIEIMANFEAVFAGGGDDLMRGDSAGNVLEGGSGDDTIAGNIGIDTMDGGDGIDTVDFTHTGVDADYNLATGIADFGGGVTETMLDFENLVAGAGNNDITGNAQGNLLFGGDGDDSILGGGGGDYIAGGRGIDTMNGGSGTDTVDFTHTDADGSFNLATGVADFGGSNVEAMLDFENVVAGGGDNVITGNPEDNSLTGGAGNDTFVFANGFGQDIIEDFSSDDAEKIDLSAVTEIADFNDLLSNHLQSVGGDTAVIVANASDLILLEGVSVSDIGVGQAYDANDFIF
jgi:Ca2+-binding RTX toxin-like protein